MDSKKAERKIRLETVGHQLSPDETAMLKFLCHGVVSTKRLHECANGSALLFEIATQGNDEPVVEVLARVGRKDLAKTFSEGCEHKNALLQHISNLDDLGNTCLNEFRVLLVHICNELTDEEDLQKLKDITTNIPKRLLAKAVTILDFFSLLMKGDHLQPQTLDTALLDPMRHLRITAWEKHLEKISGFIERLALREAEEREGSRVTLAAAEYVPKEAEAEQTSEDSNESSEETQETIPKIAETEQTGEETQENMHDVRAKEAAEAEQTRVSEESKETPEVSQENVAETENSDTDEQKQDNLGEARVSGLDYINLIGYCASNQHQINSWPSQSSMKESGTKPKRQRVYQRVENVRLEEYRMTRIPRGKAVIFNIEKFNNSTDPMLRDRTGSSVDADGIERIFRRLHFDVERFNDHDCSFHKIDKELKTLAYDTDHQDNDCLAIFLLTHGRNGQLLDADCKSFDLTPLRKYFYASNCKTLAGKPKMFFIQACQGPQRQGIVYKRIEEDIVALKPSEVPVTPMATSGDDYTNQSPDEADFLLCNSTPPGYVSYRDTENGTWFISTFIETLERDCNSFDINDILLRMNRILGEKTGNLEGNPCAQIASITSSLRRKVFLRTMPNT